MKFKVSFKWFDMWVGFYWSKKYRTLYFCPIPMIVIAFEKSHCRAYTGGKDKSGKKIHEGDVVEMNPVDDGWYDVVVWWSEKARFELKNFVEYPIPTETHRLRRNATMCRFVKDAVARKGNDNPCIVVGNIHKDPSLLKRLKGGNHEYGDR